jgi:hypothetical protein
MPDTCSQPAKVAMGLPVNRQQPTEGKVMKKIALVIVVLSSLAGCIVAPLPGPGHGRGYRGHDRDGDGVSNRYDRRPNNPYRY